MSRLLEGLLEPSRSSKGVVKTYHEAISMQIADPHSSLGTFPRHQAMAFGRAIWGGIAVDLPDELVCRNVMRHAAKCGGVMMAGYWTPSTLVLHTFENIGVHKVSTTQPHIVHAGAIRRSYCLVDAARNRTSNMRTCIHARPANIDEEETYRRQSKQLTSLIR